MFRGEEYIHYLAKSTQIYVRHANQDLQYPKS